MTKRIGLAIALAAGVAALSGCVVVPEGPGYGYGHGYGYGYGYGHRPAVRVAPPPVVVVPPPRHRYGYWNDRHRDHRGGRHGPWRP